MKTARSIEEEPERKNAHGDGHSSPELRPPVRPKSKQRDASRIAAWRFQPGRSGNPGGVPKHDLSKEIAQAVFLNNPEMIYTAYCKMMRRGNAYCFQVLAERAWGKLFRSRREISIPDHGCGPTCFLVTSKCDGSHIPVTTVAETLASLPRGRGNVPPLGPREWPRLGCVADPATTG